MPQFNNDFPIARLGQLAVYDPARLDSLIVEVPVQHNTVPVGGTTDGLYTIRIVGDEGTFDSSFTGSTSTADQIADGLAAAILANTSLQNIVDASATSGTPVDLLFLHAGREYTVTFPDNPAGNLTLTVVTSATGTPIPLGIGVTSDDGVNARLLTTGDIANDIWGITAINSDLVQGLDTAQPTVTQFLAADALTVMRSGEIWVEPEVAVAVNDPVFVRVVATGTEQAGALSNVLDGDNIQVSGRWRTATTGPGQLARVILNTP